VALLAVEALSHAFGGLAVLKDVSFALDEGEIVGLIGPNGAGKTTLINCISGVIRARQGRISLAGTLLTGLPPHAVARAGVARTFQIPRPFLSMTVLENLQVVRAAREHELRRWLQLAGLEGKANVPARYLTFQERRRLEFARALALRPRVLLLDEIVGGLSPVEIEDMLETIRDVRQSLNVSILWVEHVVHAILRTADRVMVLHFGRKLAEGSPDVIAKDHRVIAAYLGTAGGDPGAES